MALGHRMSADPFGSPPTLDERALERALDEILTEEVAGAKRARPHPTGPSARTAP